MLITPQPAFTQMPDPAKHITREQLMALHEQCLDYLEGKRSGSEVAFDANCARYENGVSMAAVGGIRSPEIDAPTALQTGANSGATFCSLYGTYQPFDGATLNELYPSHGAYVRAVRESALRNQRAGYIQSDAAREIRIDAWRSAVPPTAAPAAEPPPPVEAAPAAPAPAAI